jgi:hypothetical protein
MEHEHTHTEGKRSPAESKALFIHGLMSQREQPALDEIERKIVDLLCIEHKEPVSKCLDLSIPCPIDEAKARYDMWVQCCDHITDLASLRDLIKSKRFDEIINIPEDLPLCIALKADYEKLKINI